MRNCCMLESDDLDPQKPNHKPRDLDRLSIEELYAYIEAMKQEITRVEAKISSKKSHQDVASLLFKS